MSGLVYSRCAQLFSHVWLFATPWTVAHQTSLSMGFPRQEYWCGFPFPSPGDLPNPGIKPTSPALQADSLPLSHLGSPQHSTYNKKPEYSLEGLMLQLKLQLFGRLMWRDNSLEKPLMLGKTEGRRRRGDRGRDGWMASLVQRTRVWANSGRQWRTGKPGGLQFMGSQRVRHDLATEQQLW